MNRRAERMLVRVLLLLRREARCSPDRESDARRAEALADVILADFPRRVLPLGVAALVVILVVCALPLVRDAGLPSDPSGATVANRVERSVRKRSSAMSDGFAAIRAVVAPFSPAVVDADAQGGAMGEPADSVGEGRGVVPPREATAPFTRS
ncbi:MAG: hypothetical protein RLZZ238_811 [Planctomycetota bacterium]